METVKAYYDGVAFVPIEPVNAIRNQQAVITLVDFVETAPVSTDDSTAEPQKPKHKRRLGFVTEVPPLPESFFDPLPEEELQLWGL